jgi:hypothetical protein
MRRRLIAVLVVLALVLPATSGSAGSYRWLDRNGQVMYSDRPPRPEEVAPEGAAAPAAPPTATPIPDPPSLAFHPSVESLLDATGLKHQARLVAFQTRETLLANLGTLDAGDRERVQAITGGHLHPDTFYGLLRGEFSRHLDEARLNETLAWYGTLLGRRVAVAEVRHHASDRRRDLEEFVAGLVTNRPSPGRLALLGRLDAAAGATEGALDLFVTINRSVIRVAEPLLPVGRRPGAGQLESQARQIRLHLQEALRQLNLVTMLYLYQGLTDDELRQYIAFMESEAGAWYGTAARRAIIATVATTVERTIAELVRVVPPERWVGGGLIKAPLPSEKLKL